MEDVATVVADEAVGQRLPLARLLGRVRRAGVAFHRAALLGALAGDFLVVTAWTMLTANDVYATTYAAYALVAIEAATLYRLRGALWFGLAFGVA